MEQRHKNGHAPLQKKHPGGNGHGGSVALAEPTLDDLTLLQTLRAIRKGNFAARMPAQGGTLPAQIAETLNDIVENNQRLSLELERISRVVGKEGRLGQRMSMGPVSGAWQSSVDSINSLIADLVQPTAEAARVIGSVAKGDLSQKMPLEIDGRPLKGAFLQIAGTINTMVDQLNSFASEVTRVAREVGTEGKLGGQAVVKGVAGVWKDLTDNVNSMASNLTNQVRNIAEVTAAVAQGDLSRKITVEVKGEILALKNTINTMVDQLSGFASEVTRVAREVGTEGKLGGQAVVKGVAGIWQDLTSNVNFMAANLTNQVRNIAEVTTAVAEGDLSRKITVEVKGEILALKNTINTMVDQLNSFASEVTRVAREVGTEGKLGGQAKVKGVAGVWEDLTNNVNFMASNLTSQVRNIADVTNAVAKGDLSRKITVEVKGEILALKNTINTMVDQLNSFASEVTRVAREVGTDGKLGGQAVVKGVAGVWKDLTDNVNFMAVNLTNQVRNIAGVTKAVAKGDLSKKITVDVKGEILELKNTINTMVDQLSSFASEVTRVAREVGTEGKLGGQAKVKGVAGTWKDLTNNVNFMAANLTSQVRNIADVTKALARGDLSRKITVQAEGEILQLKNTINRTVDLLNAFASEVTRVAREVGTEGKLGGQAKVKGVAGIWKDLTSNVNSMARNLTNQVRNIADVTTAVATGDLSKKITVNVKGEILELKNTINTMVDRLNAFASEVTRMAREVGTEGKLGGQAKVKGVAGIWKDLTDNVNSMANNLTNQVRNIAQITTAVAKGDLSKKITVDVEGEMLELKSTINIMVDQLNAFASEVTRVAREVGTDGKLGGQAEVQGVGGIWKDLTNNVNFMAANLTSQVRNIAEVTKAVAKGDLSKKITVNVKGEILELKATINTMVDQLNSFASEVTRVAREVGTDGKLGGQAEVAGVAGVWKDLTNNVNSMARNLTNQVRNIAEVTTAVAQGDLSRKITVEVKGEILALKNTINTMVDQLNSFASEVTRVAREVGTEGKLGGQAVVRGVAGVWKDLTDNVNSMASNLTGQVRNIAEVTTAVASGDLSRKITVEVKGEILALKNTINSMVDQLNGFASEVTRVAREVGTDGKLGGQAVVKGVAGVWKDLTDNVNSMASNLTGQVRRIARVVTAVAKGDLKQKLALEARGEIAALADTINAMIDTLATFADQVTGVAREVGVEGKLGGQARVPGATGIWRDLTDNVNQLADNLTTQVRAIADVSTAVTKGDLTQSISVEAQGEVAALKDNINEMIRNLRETTHKNADQDWLKTNLARFTRMLQGQRDLDAVSRLVLSEVAPLVNAQRGAFYIVEDGEDGKPTTLKFTASYAGRGQLKLQERFALSEGLIGQCAVEKRPIVLTGVKAEYMKVFSGLGAMSPLTLTVLPVLFEGATKAVIELASFDKFSQIHLTFLEQLTESIGVVLNNIAASTRTEDLLKQSQSLAQKLQQTNAQLEEKARLLSEQKKEVEAKNREIEVARQSLEEKAEQLALTSKYKSQFLANMSHELRTPLNSLLILAKTLSDNADNNLTGKQVEFAKTIYASGNDLLSLINDILDLSKIESGTISIEVSEVNFKDLRAYVDRGFRQVAEQKGLDFQITLDPKLPRGLFTDSKRLQQVLRNLLSNALKFTDKGHVHLRLGVAQAGWNPENEALAEADCVVSFAVNDTGIGIPADKQKIIFEAFQQVDMTTSRKYGGTGLGLSISREIAHMLGGEIRVHSAPGRGSTFTLFLPARFVPQKSKQPEAGSEVPASLPEALRKATAAVKVSHAQDVASRAPQEIEDDRNRVSPGDPVLLVIEDDLPTARIMLDMARETGFKVLVATRGDAGLELARKFLPQAITLDLKLQDSDGWAVLDRLKHDSHTRHIPIQIFSALEQRERGMFLGAFSYDVKPIPKESLAAALRRVKGFTERPQRALLIVSPDEGEQKRMASLVSIKDVAVHAASTGEEALAKLRQTPFDCVVASRKLPDMTSVQFLDKLRSEEGAREVPVIVYGPQAPGHQEDRLKKLAQGVLVQGEHFSEELLEKTALYLHRGPAQLSDAQRAMLEAALRLDKTLAAKKVLIVDDDLRNIFALTSVLERKQMNCVYAENGRQALEMLKSTEGIDIVLMDIMMPDMDGYETMREVRKMPKYMGLPIIALTAKAMREDREKCIEAGATDYIPKPVEIEQLLSLMRVCLYR